MIKDKFLNILRGDVVVIEHGWVTFAIYPFISYYK